MSCASFHDGMELCNENSKMGRFWKAKTNITNGTVLLREIPLFHIPNCDFKNQSVSDPIVSLQKIRISQQSNGDTIDKHKDECKNNENNNDNNFNFCWGCIKLFTNHPINQHYCSNNCYKVCFLFLFCFVLLFFTFILRNFAIKQNKEISSNL